MVHQENEDERVTNREREKTAEMPLDMALVIPC